MSKALSANIHDPNHTADDYDLFFNGELIESGGGGTLTAASSRVSVTNNSESLLVTFSRPIPEGCYIISQVEPYSTNGTNNFGTGDVLPVYNSIQNLFLRNDVSSVNDTAAIGCAPLEWNADRTQLTLTLATAGSGAPFKFKSTQAGRYKFIAIFSE